ncbi:hypothetical protein ACP70R_033293 [Stipagrostis hirtigluma subsp. patula]
MFSPAQSIILESGQFHVSMLLGVFRHGGDHAIGFRSLVVPRLVNDKIGQDRLYNTDWGQELKELDVDAAWMDHFNGDCRRIIKVNAADFREWMARSCPHSLTSCGPLRMIRYYTGVLTGFGFDTTATA